MSRVLLDPLPVQQSDVVVEQSKVSDSLMEKSNTRTAIRD
jgi:hypothetical protein